ncbi:hypothetical protein ATY41_01490 [Leifsonia xyli subsp. xyli]|uniref:PA domain-containing protein n=1 Tax=Leifsonia xyli subsp. xyli TaxID=59736 RepID=A0A1E2SNN7_LEIXY|nr:PA domain-containing protein [Leifsonia xyli]ODA91379.1 hypothetical protein ATY41_01490 [Leifsonia xyli subsp. xyli]
MTLTAADGASYHKAGVTLTQGVTPSPVVLASAVSGYEGGAECTAPFAAGTLTGKVVACERGENDREDKGANALQGGAAEMILYNPVTSDTEADSQPLPAIHLDGPNDDLVSFLKAHPDGSAAGVFQRGAGSIRANRALSPTLTISETAAKFATGLTDRLSRINLNLPSVSVDPLPGAAVVKRTVTNVTSSRQSFAVTTRGGNGLSIGVYPSWFSLSAGKSRELTVTLNGLEAKNGWHEGQITITPYGRGTPVVLPVAANKGDAAIALTQSCAPAEIEFGATTTCTVSAKNQMPVDVDSHVKTFASPFLPLNNVTAPAKRSFMGADWSGTLSGAKPATIDSFAPETLSEWPGDFDSLASYGAPPKPDYGDGGGWNYTVPAFKYGGETYTSLNVMSDDYIIVGYLDKDFIPPQYPSDINGKAPNNAIAAFWTDMDPSSPRLAENAGIRIAILTNNRTDVSWLIMEWDRIPTADETGANTFQLWLRLGDTEGQRVFYQGKPQANATGGSFTVAENRDGTSGKAVDVVDPALTYAIHTSPPQAGGAVTFDYTLRGFFPGTWPTLATLPSSALNTYPGVQTKITVSPWWARDIPRRRPF